MPDPIPQAAAVPLRDGRVCLVTSRSRKRWVIPKGRIDPGHTAAQAAIAEAWEEAGLVGTLRPDPIGSYHYEKFGRDHLVTVFVLDVTDERSAWPERGVRKREWVPVEEAVGRVAEQGLRAILAALAAAVAAA
jgi:8-oxo-dGTP pyrophosphatase MutT (NUDIX family)